MEVTPEMLAVGKDETVVIPARLFLDLVEAAGWVSTMAASVDLATVGDPNAIMFLAGEAAAIGERSKEWIERNWPTPTPDEAAAMEIDMGPADEQFIWQEPLAVRFIWQPPPIRWLTLDDGLYMSVKALNTGAKAWGGLSSLTRRRFVVAAVQELLLMAEGTLLTTDFDAAKPHWMPLFATLSEEFHMNWEQMIDAARGL